MNYKKIIGVTVGIVLIVVILSFLVVTHNIADKKESIKIGATLALTSPLSFIGVEEYNGLKMAVDEINSNGGVNSHKIELTIEDNKGDSAQAVNTVRKLLDVDDVDIVVSAYTHITTSIQPIVTDNGKILLTTWRETPIGILIHSKELYENYKKYFDEVWKIAKS